MIAGVGLERRDYRTLAAATHDLPVDVRISGFSRFAASAARSFPDPLPANMSRRFYEWPELVQLYRDADVVVAPLFPSPYAAGVTTLMEGLACGRPVVATRTEGLRRYLAPDDGLSLVEAFDAAGLRRAILRLLEHPAEAEAQGRAGLALRAPQVRPRRVRRAPRSEAQGPVSVPGFPNTRSYWPSRSGAREIGSRHSLSRTPRKVSLGR